MAEKTDEIVVFISSRDSECAECKNNLGRKAWIRLIEGKGALCLECADLAHLEFLPTGNATLTRRSKKHSKLSAVVLKWSSSRKRYERQGLLVEEEAITQAEKECLADGEVRERQRARAAERRESADATFIEAFAAKVRQMFPKMPAGRESVIAAHACEKYSGRVGRSASAKDLEEEAVTLAVRAHIRHQETEYDELMMSGMDRHEARSRVRSKVNDTAERWAEPGP